MVLVLVAPLGAAYVGIHPAIPILVILGVGLYLVGRIDGPKLPEGRYIFFGSTYGVHVRAQDYMPPDTESHSGGNFRDGVDPDELNRSG